jgi:hypothetical protein
MASLDRQGAEAQVARVLGERLEKFRAALEALGRDMAEPISLGSLDSAGKPSGDGGRPVDLKFLFSVVKGLSEAQDQIALLDRLLEGASGCFSRACLFLIHGEAARGWSSFGLPEGEGGDPAGSLEVSLKSPSLLKSALEDRAAVQSSDPAGYRSLLPSPAPGERLPRQAMALPIQVRGRVRAILYGDDGGDAAEICERFQAEILCRVASLAADHLALEGQRESTSPATAEVEVRIPPVDEDGESIEAGEPMEPDLLEEELEYASFARESQPGSSDLTPEESRQHEDARRFARLLISELLLYHEDAVVTGRKQRDIYSRLALEIDKSRQAYDQRVPQQVRVRFDYFQEELVRTLAQGDALALGRA